MEDQIEISILLDQLGFIIRYSPFEAYPVVAGMTFCYGGLKTSINGEVYDKNGGMIEGLYAVGEMLGGLWYKNYPSGGGMMAGAVFGKNAGNKASTI